MNLILCRNRTIGSALLRLATWSQWSHVAIHDEGIGVVFDTTFAHGGCRAWPEADFRLRYPDREERELVVDNPPAARAWLLNQLGKPYDWSAIAGFVFRRDDWNKPDAWFCSEHFAAFFNEFVRPAFKVSLWRVTPRDVDMVV